MLLHALGFSCLKIFLRRHRALQRRPCEIVRWLQDGRGVPCTRHCMRPLLPRRRRYAPACATQCSLGMHNAPLWPSQGITCTLGQACANWNQRCRGAMQQLISQSARMRRHSLWGSFPP